jgi:hypothetical protein
MTASDFRGFIPTLVFVASFWIASTLGATLEAALVTLAGGLFAAITIRTLLHTYPERVRKYIGWVSFVFAFMGVVPLILYALKLHFAD